MLIASIFTITLTADILLLLLLQRLLFDYLDSMNIFCWRWKGGCIYDLKKLSFQISSRTSTHLVHQGHAMLTAHKNRLPVPRHLSGILHPTQDINTTPIECLLEDEDRNIASFFKVGRGRGRPARKKNHQLAESSKP